MFGNIINKIQNIDDFDTELTETGVQTKTDEDVVSQLNISCEKDEIIPWDSPELRRPICSWSTFPNKVSPQLEALVNLFDSNNGQN